MKLSENAKSYIKANYNRMSPEEMANAQQVHPRDIREYILLNKLRRTNNDFVKKKERLSSVPGCLTDDLLKEYTAI
jgi:hypothetical protein